ncbi:MAG: SUF system NifU family Fe-S cluster assembly protein [Candidatus Dadabacteria bacterium]|nr:MAG: SUF system NifU family Fe-S cluster assembly protein [Candidatus Dadabacteria bacterium]
MSLEELYQDLILDHFKNPRNKGPLKEPTASCSLLNPLCGDEIEVNIKDQDNSLPEIKFSGKGCAISQASASMMTELCAGRSREEVLRLCETFRKLMRGEIEPEEAEELQDVLALEGVRKFAPRVKCAVLAWEALEKCLKGQGEV